MSLFLERFSHAQQASLSACASDQFGLRMPRLISIAASEGQIHRMPQVVQSTFLAAARKVLLCHLSNLQGGWQRSTFLAAARKALCDWSRKLGSRPGKVKPYRVVNIFWYSMRGWVLAPIHALIHVGSIAAWTARSEPRYLFCESLWLRYPAKPQALKA